MSDEQLQTWIAGLQEQYRLIGDLGSVAKKNLAILEAEVTRRALPIDYDAISWPNGAPKIDLTSDWRLVERVYSDTQPPLCQPRAQAVWSYLERAAAAGGVSIAVEWNKCEHTWGLAGAYCGPDWSKVRIPTHEAGGRRLVQVAIQAFERQARELRIDAQLLDAEINAALALFGVRAALGGARAPSGEAPRRSETPSAGGAEPPGPAIPEGSPVGGSAPLAPTSAEGTTTPESTPSTSAKPGGPAGGKEKPALTQPREEGQAGAPRANAPQRTLLQTARDAGVSDEIEGPIDVFAFGTTQESASNIVANKLGKERTFAATNIETARVFAARRVTRVKGSRPGVVGIALPKATVVRLKQQRLLHFELMTDPPPELTSNPGQWIIEPEAIQAFDDDGFFFLIE